MQRCRRVELEDERANPPVQFGLEAVVDLQDRRRLPSARGCAAHHQNWESGGISGLALTRSISTSGVQHPCAEYY